MQQAEKSCAQCRARKTKCDLSLPRCFSCQRRDLVCHFGARRKPGPAKGFKRQPRQRENNDGSRNDQPQRETRNPATASSPPSLQSVSPVDTDSLLSTLSAQDYSMLDEDSVLEPKAHLDELWALEDQLVEAYSRMKLFPFFPHVRKQHLLDPGLPPTLRSALVNAVCAISACSASGVIFERVSISPIKAAEIFATRARTTYLRHTREEDHPTTLSVVKVAALLAAYEMYCSPGIKGWATVGEAVRLSYDMRLDQLDSNSHLTSAFMSDEDAEDCRSVWWSVYSLDVYASSTLMRPFAITSTGINTALVSTPEAQFKMGDVNPSQRLLLPSDPVELQVMALSLDHSDPLSTQTLYLLVMSFGRCLSNMRREQLDGKEVDSQSDLIQNTLATFRFSIPGNFIDPQGCSNDPHLRLTRIEIVLLLELWVDLMTGSNACIPLMLTRQSLCLNTYPSLGDTLSTNLTIDPFEQAKFPEFFDANESFSGSGGWHACIQSATAIVKIVRSLTSQDLARISPSMASIFWLPAVTLVLHHRTRTSLAEQSDAASGAEVLKAAMKHMGSNWNIAKNFHDALATLRTGPAATTTELQMRYVLQFYSSPLISVSHGRNQVNIPSF